MAELAAPETRARPARGPIAWLAALTPTGRARVPAAWALYDFANTIFSIGVVSTAMGLWLTEPSRFGQDTRQLVLSVAVAVSVGINAIVSPILGAISDRVRRRLPALGIRVELTGPARAAAAVALLVGSGAHPQSATIGDSDFVSNVALAIQGNRDLFLNTDNWLAQQENLIAIRPREPEDRRITITADQERTVFWLAVVFIPGVLLLTGFYTWWRRR